MNLSGEKSTIAMITLLLVVGLLIGTHSARAAPFAPTSYAEAAPILHKADSPHASGWRAVGESYYFENCWWQRQQYYANGRPTKKVTNRKLSCPGLSFSADRIKRPSPNLGSGTVRLKR